jgi:DNA-binding PadR family transcriptional regulator
MLVNGAARDLGEKSTTAMRSPVNWALLGLVIERPSYGYELVKRFQREYEDVLPLSSESHVYTALKALERRELIEEVPGKGGGRQPKPCYRATTAGIRDYQARLIAQIHEDRARSRLFVRQLAILTNEPDAALRVLEHFEQACLQEARDTRICTDSTAVVPAFAERLMAEESRLAMEAKLPWVEYARERFERLTARERQPR